MSVAVPSLALEQREASQAPTREIGYLLSVLSIGLACGAYFVLRYIGFWSETDSAIFALMIEWMKDAGRIQYAGSYTHGYGYQVWAATLSHLTGINVGELLQIYTPLIGNIFLGLFGFAAFRRLLSSERLGVLAASVLFMVPELVFTVSRGNHEKLTVSLTLLALLCLLNSFVNMGKKGHWRVFASWAILFYFVIFTLASFNAFFGSGFITASTLTLVFAFIALRLMSLGRGHVVAYRGSGRSKHPEGEGIGLETVVARLTLMVVTGWLLVVLVTWYIYPSTGHNYSLLSNAVERFSVLFLGATPTEQAEPVVASDPYTLGGTDWSSVGAYRLLSSFRWVMFIGSLITWVVLLVRALPRLSETPLNRLFLLSFYGAFGFQLALAIPIDFLDLHAGTNLQVRMYTYFSLLAPPIFVLGLVSLVERAKAGLFRTVLVGTIGLFLIGFFFLSMLKATLDPTVSNRWLFYHPSEVRAIHFWNMRQEHSILWLDPEGRLRYAYLMAYRQGPIRGNEFNVARPMSVSLYAIYSPTNQENAIAWKRAPSPYWFENLPYDNGETQIFSRIPRTPFQR